MEYTLGMENFAQHIALSYQKATHSPDASTQNGAVIVDGERFIAWGENHVPDGILANVENKYDYWEHAERAAIYQAAWLGERVKGCTMFCPWAACPNCARGIILSGISRLVVHKERMVLTPDRCKDPVAVGLKMLREAGVEVVEWSGKIGKTIQVDGKEVEL